MFENKLTLVNFIRLATLEIPSIGCDGIMYRTEIGNVVLATKAKSRTDKEPVTVLDGRTYHPANETRRVNSYIFLREDIKKAPEMVRCGYITLAVVDLVWNIFLAIPYKLTKDLRRFLAYELITDFRSIDLSTIAGYFSRMEEPIMTPKSRQLHVQLKLHQLEEDLANCQRLGQEQKVEDFGFYQELDNHVRLQDFWVHLLTSLNRRVIREAKVTVEDLLEILKEERGICPAELVRRAIENARNPQQHLLPAAKSETKSK